MRLSLSRIVWGLLECKLNHRVGPSLRQGRRTFAPMIRSNPGQTILGGRELGRTYLPRCIKRGGNNQVRGTLFQLPVTK